MSTSTRSRNLRPLAIPAAAAAAAGAIGAVIILTAGGSTAAAGSAPASIAGYIPADSPLYLQVSTDTAGPQWTNLNRLGALFPGFGDMRADLEKTIAREGLDWQRDVQPLLGDSAAVAVTELPEAADALSGAMADPAAAAGRAAATAADTPVMAVLQVAPGRAAQVRDLITRNPGGMKETGTRDGATLYADPITGMSAALTEESLIIGSRTEVVDDALAAHAAGGDAVLSGVFRFNDALGLLPDDVFAMGYVNLDEAGKAASEAVPQVGVLAGSQMKGAAAMSVTVEPDGLRMKAVLVDAPPMARQSAYAPTLAAQAPADAVAFLGFNRLADTVATAVTAAQGSASDDTKKQINAIAGQLPLLLGVNTDDLRNLTGGEHAVVISGTGTSPQAALALTVEDGARATRSLSALSTTVPMALGRFGPDSLKVGKATPFAEGAVKGKIIPLGRGRSVAWGVRGDLAAIGTGASAVAGVIAPRPATTSLASAPGFAEATRGMPDQVTGMAYVDMRKATRMLARAGAFEGSGASRKRADLAPLTHLAAWSTDGATPTVEVFVGMGRP